MKENKLLMRKEDNNMSKKNKLDLNKIKLNKCSTINKLNKFW